MSDKAIAALVHTPLEGLYLVQLHALPYQFFMQHPRWNQLVVCDSHTKALVLNLKLPCSHKYLVLYFDNDSDLVKRVLITNDLDVVRTCV